ncbi:MAG: flagellar motor protein MotB [Nitrospina sp.]|nr:flagellar motor protein MotB [Nitrospina sp.]
MAEADPTQAKLKKYEKAVKKLKAANAKAEKELTDQKKTFESALAEKASLVESLKAAAGSSGGEDDGSSEEAQQEILEDREAQLEEEQKKVIKLEEKAVLLEAATKDKLEAQKVKIEEEWKKKFEEAQLNADAPKAEKKSSGEGEVPGDYIPGGVEPWMATFADMVTLLMVFFVLFYSVEKDNTEKFKSAIDMMVEEDGPEGLGKIMQVMDSTKIMQNMREMKAAAKAAAAAEDTTVEKKIVLRVPGLNLFKKGGAKLSPEARPVLDEIIKIIKKKGDHKIFIQGHTDDIPINTPKFESNWELSAVRATAVLRYFYDKGIDPEMLTATGYADTFPYVPNDTKEGRAKNRRIEFILEKMPEKDAAKAREEKAKKDKIKKDKASKA